MRRFLVAVLVLVVVFAVPAFARKWTSRSGGFSIEAELADVRDGNAVLRKADGTEVSVPLNKLSLADVRYIKEELQAAEKAVGVTSEPRPTSTTTPPAASEPVSTPAAEPATPAKSRSKPSAASPRSIRYGWKPNQTYMYRLKVEAQIGDAPHAVNGIVNYTVETVGTDGTVELSCIETISGSSSSATYIAPSPIRYRSRYPSRSYHPGYYASSHPTTPDRITIDRHGRILRVEGGEDLPYLLGRAAHLPIERLSPLDENPWTVSSDVAVALHKIDWLPHRDSLESRQEQLPATEKSIYTVRGSDSKGIHLAKTYEMATGVLVDGKPRAAMSGEGELTFDPQMGVFSSSKMKMRLAVRDGGIAVEWTATVSYELVSEAELAKIKADNEKSRKAFEELARERDRPIGPEDVDKILKDIQSGDSTKMSTASHRLNAKRPQEPNRKMAAGLEALLKSDTPRVRQIAADALQYWATQESIPVLIKLLDDKNPVVRSHAIEALGQLKATSAIDRLIKMWPEEFQVTRALTAMGSAAEPAVLKQFTSGNDLMRMQAIQVLTEIGTSRSIPSLEKAARSDGVTQFLAKHALDAIKRRQ